MDTPEAIDVFCHFLPPKYVQRLSDVAAHRLPFMFSRACTVRSMVDLEARFRVMDEFSGYGQIPSLTSPPLEAVASPEKAAELAKIANEEFAALSSKHPHRFPSFVATLPLNNPAAAHAELDRSVKQLGAAGAQVFTNVKGAPIDQPETLGLFQHAAELGCAVWLHPIRPMTQPDYPGEDVSKFDLWWALGWPHESSVAMGRLVFSGLFERHPDLVVVTHHVGGTIPMMAGRLGPGLDMLGTRTPEKYSQAVQHPLASPPLDSFRRFYADTASFGSLEAVRCGIDFFQPDRILFATDMPFDPEGGPGFIRSTLRALQDLDLTPQQRQDILWGNAQRALKLHRLVPNKPTQKARQN